MDADEVGDPRVARRVVDRRRRAFLQHLAFVDHDEPVRQQARLVEVMGHQHDRDRQFATQVGEQAVQPLPRHLVDSGERLVEQQQARLARQRAGDGDALLLATRQRCRPARLLIRREPDVGEPAPRFGQAPVVWQVQQRQRDVAERVEVRHERVVLEHQPDMAALRHDEHAACGVAPGLVADDDMAALRPHQPGQHADHRGLARARRAHQRQQFAGRAAERAGQRHRPLLLDREVERAAGRGHRRTASRADAKNEAATAPSESSMSSRAMRSALARSKACTRS